MSRMALRPLSKIARLSNMHVAVNKTGTQAQVTFPGFSLDDIDRTGNISVWRVQRFLDLTGARMAAYRVQNPETGTTFLEYDKLNENFYTFVASTCTEVSRDFYRLPDALKLPPLHTTVHLGYVGNSSLNSVAVLKDLDSGKELARNVHQVVTVHRTTKKPTPIPQWWNNKYNGSAVENQRLIIAPIDVPHKSFKYEMKVPWSEITFYKHTNHPSYIRFCFDAAMDAMQSGFYSKFTPGDDILNYHVKKMSIAYKDGTQAGDVLAVRTWENTDNPFVLHFDIEKGGKTINQNTMEFYEPET